MTNEEYIKEITTEDDMTLEEMWNFLTERNIATDNELTLITNINGYNEETMNDVLYARTGYRSIEQYCEYEE